MLLGTYWELDSKRAEKGGRVGPSSSPIWEKRKRRKRESLARK